MTSKDDDIEKVQKAEQRRGLRRRPIDDDLRQEHNARSAAFARALDHYDDSELKEFMRKYGISPGSPQWNAGLRAWNEYHGRKV